MAVYVKISTATSDPLFNANSFWDLPTIFVESVLKNLTTQQKEAANTASFSSATSAALLYCIISGLGGNDAEFNPAKFLPCSLETEDVTPDDDYLEVDSAALKVFFIELEAKRVPGWVFSALSSNFSHWRKQIA